MIAQDAALFVCLIPLKPVPGGLSVGAHEYTTVKVDPWSEKDGWSDTDRQSGYTIFVSCDLKRHTDCPRSPSEPHSSPLSGRGLVRMSPSLPTARDSLFGVCELSFELAFWTRPSARPEEVFVFGICNILSQAVISVWNQCCGFLARHHLPNSRNVHDAGLSNKVPQMVWRCCQCAFSGGTACYLVRT
jgi:hypothetical protein